MMLPTTAAQLLREQARLSAAETKQRAEGKAKKCLFLAQLLLPHVELPLVEDQAVDLMDVPDDVMERTLHRIAAQRCVIEET